MNISSIAQDRRHWRTLQAEVSTLKGKGAADKSSRWCLFTQVIILLQIEEGTAFGKGTKERHSKFAACDPTY